MTAFEDSIADNKFNLKDLINGMDIYLYELYESNSEYYKADTRQFDFADFSCIVSFDISWYFDFDTESIRDTRADIFRAGLIDEHGIEIDLTDDQINSLLRSMNNN